jgi:hypothetical protein
MKTYDTFTPNILEMQGKTERKSFHFIADNCKIWEFGGHCTADINGTFEIDAKVNPFDGKIEVSIDNSKIEGYITNQICFSEISMLNDRILWSNNIFGGGGGFEYRDMSLFYCNGILSRIYFNRNNPLRMLEFTSNQQGKIADVENPLQTYIRSKKNIAETIGKTQTVDLSNVYFVSDSHQRYENGVAVRGLQQGCKRAVKIENNISGNEGYSVTIYTLDGARPFGGNNVIMRTKPMKVIQRSEEKIILRGFGYDKMAFAMGAGNDASFANYGLSIYLKYDEIDKCTLHMHDRNN